MSHQRKVIRDAVVARLLTDLAGQVGERVYPNRIRPLFQSTLPCILVYSVKEPSEISLESPREYRRNLQLIIEVAAKADDSLDDTLDELCRRIENSIFSEETFGGVVSDTLLTDTEISILSEGNKLIGSAQITLQMPYYSTLPDDLTDDLDDLETIHTEIDLGSNDTSETEDDLDLT